jgi:hypothetical protein
MTSSTGKIDLGERVEVSADGGVSAGAGCGIVAEKVTALLVEALIESSARVVDGTCEC